MKRGFATMPPERVRELALEGARASLASPDRYHPTVADARRGGLLRGPAGPGHCSVCGKVGHTRRTCEKK